MPPQSFKKSRMTIDEMELWAEAYIHALFIYPDYDSSRAIYKRYPVSLERLIREKLLNYLSSQLVNSEFPIFDIVS